MRYIKKLMLAGLLAWSSLAQAQEWPSKPVHIILPIGAGNVNDLAARLVADKLGTMWGQRVVVENYGGAGGIVGMGKLVRSANDGYTFGFIPGSISMVTPVLYKEPGFNVEKDLVPVATVGEVPYLIAVKSNSPIRTLDDLVQEAKRNPGKLSLATQFLGSGAHLAAERIASAAGVKFFMVPYKGVTEAVTSVVSGETQVTMQAVSTMADLVKSGQLRALAVSSEKRLPGWDNVPATSETIPGSAATAWFGIFGLTGTPPEIIEKMSRDVNEVIQMPEIVEKFAVGGIYPLPGRQVDLAKKITVETPIWGKLARDAGLKVQ